MSLRLVAGSKVTVSLKGLSALCTSGGNLSWKLYLFRDTVATTAIPGANFVAAAPGSAAEYDTSATAINTAGATLIDAGFMTSSNDLVSVEYTGSNNTFLTVNIAGLSDIMTWAMQSTGPGENVARSIVWKEVY